MRHKNSNYQRKSPNMAKVIFPYHKEMLLKEIIRSLWKSILSFKRSSYLKKKTRVIEENEPLLDPVVSLCVRNFFVFWLYHWRSVSVVFSGHIHLF